MQERGLWGGRQAGEEDRVREREREREREGGISWGIRVDG